MFRITLALALLCVFQLATAQRASDRYPALAYWDFAYCGAPDSVDCIFNNVNKELYISGFDTDGQGTFWFAGGEPLRVSCFKGTQLQWRREVADRRTTRALMRLHGDSLYLVHDLDRELIVMHKDGKGKPRYCPLPIDSVSKGRMRPDCIVLWYNAPVVHNGDTCHRVKHDYCVLNYEPRVLWKETLWGESDGTYMTPEPKRPWRFANNEYLEYKGRVGDHNVYRYGRLDFVFDYLLDPYLGETKVYRMKEQTLDFDVMPLWVLTDEVDHETHLSSEETRFVRGNKYYEVGFDWKNKQRLTVSELDLEKALEQAEKLGN